MDLKLVTDGLNGDMSALSPSERIRLLRITGAILEMLAAQSGGLRASSEEEASHG